MDVTLRPGGPPKGHPRERPRGYQVCLDAPEGCHCLLGHIEIILEFYCNTKTMILRVVDFGSWSWGIRLD